MKLTSRNMNIQMQDSFSIDAFGRSRVSNPQTLFDSKNIFDDDGLAANVENQPLFYDNQETAGTAGDAFTYADETYSAVQIARGKTANTVTDGIDLTGGFIESGGVQSGSAGSTDGGIENAILLGSTIAGVVDSIVLCVRPIGGTSDVDVEGSLTWREIT